MRTDTVDQPLLKMNPYTPISAGITSASSLIASTFALTLVSCHAYTGDEVLHVGKRTEGSQEPAVSVLRPTSSEEFNKWAESCSLVPA